jgi:hypothetical protein
MPGFFALGAIRSMAAFGAGRVGGPSYTMEEVVHVVGGWLLSVVLAYQISHGPIRLRSKILTVGLFSIAFPASVVLPDSALVGVYILVGGLLAVVVSEKSDRLIGGPRKSKHTARSQ